MAINLHGDCKTRLKEQLAEALCFAKVKNNSFLVTNSFGRVLSMESTLPSNRAQKDALDSYISESPLFDFVVGYLSKEINENQIFNLDMPEQNLNELPEYEDLDTVSDRLIELFDTLPWKYCFTFNLNSQITEYHREEITEISESIKILRKGDELVSNFPLESGIFGRDQFLHGRGLLGLGSKGEWNEDNLHVQVLVDGFMGKWVATSTEITAIDSLKSFLGLLIATRVLTVEHSFSSSIVKSQFYVHQKYNNEWKIHDSGELDDDISKTISDLRIDDLNGYLVTDDDKTAHVKRNLRTISKALGAADTSDKIRLAGQWFFDSYCGKNELLSYIQTTVSLEILLGEKAVSDIIGLGELLRNRCAYLIGKSHSQREKVLSDFKKIYDIRSKIVHRGKSKLSNHERSLFSTLQWIVSRVIQEEIKLIGESA